MAEIQDKAAADQPAPGARVRALMHRSGRATLATRLTAERAREQLDAGDWPYASLVTVAHDHDGSPLLLLSDLADHSRNLAADARLALLYDGTAGWREPLAGPRATVFGRAESCEGDERLLSRYLARHPGARRYAGFADFRLFRVAVAGAHLVAGFGAIHWLPAAEVLADCAGTAPLAEAEAGILAHVNQDHADAVALIVRYLLREEGAGWRLCGIDPEGADFEREGHVIRLDFDLPIDGPAACRERLVQLTARAREIAAKTPQL